MFNRTNRHIKDQRLSREGQRRAIVYHLVALRGRDGLARFLLFYRSLLTAFFLGNETTEDKNLRASNLGSASREDCEALGLTDVVDGLPHLLFNLINFHLTDKIKWLTVADSCKSTLETLSSEHEDELFVEVAH